MKDVTDKRTRLLFSLSHAMNLKPVIAWPAEYGSAVEGTNLTFY